MTGLVARLAIPAPLQVAWTFLRPVLPYVIGAVCILLLVLHFEAVGARRQATKDASVIASWKTAFGKSDANFRTAIGMVDNQTAHVRALAVAGDQRARAAAAARSAALAANKSLVQYQSTLAKVAKRNYSSAEPCTTPPEVLKGIN